ncbi:MAG: segregation/condensation protein A [Planctomycetota bacterium]|nr:segregation/condensation protein A [Planctomycetota bacterium]
MTQFTGEKSNSSDGSESTPHAPARTPEASETGVAATPASIPASTPDSTSASTSAAIPASVQQWEDGFCTDLEDYSGPLELLLYLIHKNEINILDIPVAQVLEQFLAHVTGAQLAGTLDLRQAGDYLVMGARLVEIKCRMLSPELIEAEDELLEEELDDPRQSLVEQLLEYRDFKERAQLLEEAHRLRSLGYERLQDEMPPPPPGTLDLSETSSLDLASAFQRVLDLLSERSAFTVISAEEIPIEQSMTEVLERLRRNPSTALPFDQLFPHRLGIAGAVSTLLAILELARMHQLRLEQGDPENPLLVHLREKA